MKANKTLNELWSEGTEYLEDWGLEDARWESRLLLSAILGLDGVNFLLELYRPVASPHSNRLFDLLERRRKGEPLQYLVGTVNFMGFEFKVTPDVFIPRPETEILVETLVGRIRRAGSGSSKPVRVLDIGTGCGNISLSVACLAPQASVVAMDVSKRALDVAKKNAKQLGLEQRVSFIRRDLNEGVPPMEGPFDYVVSNPPYIRRSDLPDLPPEVRREPWRALDGGDDGLDFYRILAKHFVNNLGTAGCLACEVGWGQIRSVVKILALTRRFFRIEVIKDYRGIDRVVIAHKLS